MAEQKIKLLDEQIEKLMKLKELAIEETKTNAYDDETKNMSINMKILNAPDIETFEFLLKKYDPENKTSSKGEILFMKVLESENLIFASSLFLGGHIESFFTEPHYCADDSDFISLLILAIKKKDIDRLKMLMEIAAIKYAIVGEQTFNYRPASHWANLTEYEIKKYNKIISTKQDDFTDDHGNHATENLFDDFHEKLIRNIIYNAPFDMPYAIFTYILEKYLFITESRYKVKKVDIHTRLSPLNDITFANCYSLNFNDIMNDIGINDFNKRILKYLVDFINNGNFGAITEFSKLVDFSEIHNFISYFTNKTMNSVIRKGVLAVFENSLAYGMDVEYWVGINLETVSLKYFVYYTNLIKTYESKFTSLEDIRLQKKDNARMILYLVKINRLDLVEYIMLAF